MKSVSFSRRAAGRNGVRRLILATSTMVALSATSPALTATYTVSNAGDLSAAIAAANANPGDDTILLAADINMSALLPVITEGVTIDGGGFALTSSERLFFVDAPAGTVNIANFSTLTGTATGGDGGNGAGGGMGAGGAIFVNAGTVNVGNVSFASNSATGGAGGALISTDNGGGGGGGLGGDGGDGGSSYYGGGGGGGGFSGGGGGGGSFSQTINGTSSYTNLETSTTSTYPYSYSDAGSAGAGGAGAEAGGAGSATGAGSAGFDGAAGGAGGTVSFTNTGTYTNTVGYTDCYYSWWGGGYCYYVPASSYTSTENQTLGGGGGGGGGGDGAGAGGAGVASATPYSYSYYWSTENGSYTNHSTNVAAGGGGGGGGLGGGGGTGGGSGSLGGADGGLGTGGGGAALNGTGGDGGDFGGGGGGSRNGDAGAGGFGGGGGGGVYSAGGLGGFGGGGGGSVFSTAVVGGAGGGSGGAYAGGGGAGLGGAIFARDGATLNIGGGVSFSGSSATGGAAGGTNGTGGAGAGSDLFLMSGTTTNLSPGAGNSIVLSGTIGDDSAQTLANGTATGATIAVSGGGAVQIDGTSSIAGGFTVGADTALVVGATGVIGAPGTAVQLIGSGSLLDNGGTIGNSGAGTDPLVGITANGTVVNRAGATLFGPGTAIEISGGALGMIDLQAGSTTTGDIRVADASSSVRANVEGTLNGLVLGHDGADVLRVGATGTIGGVSMLFGGDDQMVLVNGGAHNGVDAGDGSDTLYLEGFTTLPAMDLSSLSNFENLGKSGAGTLTIDSVPPGFTQFYAGNGGADDGVLAFSGTNTLTGDIYVNGAILRADTAGAFGTATIHTIDPTIQFGATGTYDNDIMLEVAAPASADPTRLEAINGSTATLTGVIATGTTPTTDPVQYVTIGGDGTIVLANNANSWLGTTTIEAGAALVGTSNSISGGNIVASGSLSYVQALGGTVNQDISGTGQVVVAGMADGETLTFAGDLSFSGELQVLDSGIALNGANAIGSVTLDGAFSTLGVASGASLTASTNYAVRGLGAASVDNQGQINGTTYIGVGLFDGGTLVNGSVTNSAASITGYYTGSSNAGSSPITVINHGSISGTLFNGLDGHNLTVTNAATGQIVGNGQFGSGMGVGVDSTGSLSLTNDGAVLGRTAGIRAWGTTAVTNRGLIGSGSLSGTTLVYSDGYDGVQSYGGGTIDNQTGGRILGSISGVYNAAGTLTVTNAGTINGQSYGFYNNAALTLNNLAGGQVTGGDRAVVSYGTVTIDNAAGGTISGQFGAVHADGAGVTTVSNAGTMLGGVYSTGGGDLSVTNQASGDIVRASHGSAIDVANGGLLTVQNAGDIVGYTWGVVGRNSGDSIVNSGRIATGTISSETIAVGGAEAVSLVGGTLTNLAGGQILGNSIGVVSSGNLTLINAGTISGAAAGVTAGIWTSGGAGSVTNLAGATISGGGWGAVHAGGAGAFTVTNAGTMSGTTFNGVYAGSSTANTVTNQAGGAIIGGNAAIYNDGANLTVDNAGLIRITGGSANTVVSGVYSSAAGASITNSGTIESTLASGNGIRLDQGGTIVNLAGGTISGGSGGLAIDLRGNSTLDLRQGSTINGTISASGAASVTAAVAGAVNGAYDASTGTGADLLTLEATGSLASATLGGGNDVLTLRGGHLAGQADGGAGADALAFDIAGGTASYDTALFAGFESRTKTGAGTLSLSGVDGLTVDFSVTGGTLAVSGGAAINDGAAISLAGGSTFQLGSSEAIRTLSGSGAVSLGTDNLALVGNDSSSYSGAMSGTGSLIKAGTGTFTLLGANDFTGGLLVSGGSVALGGSERLADSSVVGINSGATFDLAGFTETIGALTGNGSVALGSGRLAVSSALNSQFAGQISGTGGLTKAGSGLLLLTGANTYTGATIVNGGLLAVNGSLASTVTVNNGGVIGGNGTIGGLLVNSGGILAPGNSIGHLTVNGDVTFAAGSIYQVETTPTAADLTSATGNVVINGGTVQVLASGTLYAPLTTYLILEAGGTVSGTFNGVTSNLAFLDPSLAYTSNQVQLTLRRNDIQFADAATTTNQIAVADAVQGLDSGLLYDAVLVQALGGARQAFDALSGEIYATTPMLMAEEGNRLLRAMRNAERRRAGGMMVWADASRAVTSHDGRMPAGAASARGDSDAFIGGLGYSSGGLSISGGGGVATSDVNVDARASKAEVRSTLVGADIGYRGAGFEVSGGITHSWHDIDTRRTIAFPGLADNVESSRDGRITQIDLSGALPTTAYGIEVAPFVELGHQWVRLDDTVETGGLAALSIDAERFETTRTVLGARMQHSFAGWGGVITPRVSFGWEHLMGDREGHMSASVDGSSRFAIEGVRRGANAARVRAGIDADMGSVHIGLGYDGRLASSDDRQSVNLNVGLRF